MIIEGNYEIIQGTKGGGGAAPAAPVTQPDSLRSLSLVEIIEAICEGEIEGFATTDPLESVYLDDTPLRSNGVDNFQGVSVDYRLGTQSQTHIPGTEDYGSSSLVSVNVEIPQASPQIRRISDNLVDAVRVTLLFQALMKVNTATGDKTGITVLASVEVSIDDGASWIPADLHGRGTISGKTESPYERSFVIDLRTFGDAPYYDIRVSRISADPVTGENSSFRWESYTKINYAKLRYPNTVVIRTTFDARSFNNIPVRSYLLKGKRVKVPNATVYDPVSRTYLSNDWDGTFVTAFTRCPAWIFYDLVTNPRYGLGELINPAYADKWSLFTIAKRCDELIQDGFGGQEHRYSLDLFLQTDEDAKKVIYDIASAFDCMAYWGNGAIKLTQDSPKTTSAIFVPGNVTKGQFNYVATARQVRYNAAIIQWNDPEDRYRIASEYVEDVEGINKYGYREIAKATIGCTSRGQAHRAGKSILLTSRLETETVTFSVGLEGLTADIGHVIRIADPLRASQGRFGGRIISGSTTSSIALDAPVILASGKTYNIALINPLGGVIDNVAVNPAGGGPAGFDYMSGNTIITGVVTNAPGSTSLITLSTPLSALPEVDTAWIIYEPALLNNLYRILSISENEKPENGFYSITAAQYTPSKYTLLDSIGALPALPTNPFITTSIVPPSGIIVSQGVYLANEGIKRYIDVSWSASTDKFLRGYRIVYRFEGNVIRDTEVDGQSDRINNPSAGTYEITLMSVTVLGKYSTSLTVSYTLGELYLVEYVSITGLVLVGGGTEFTGRSPEIDWDTDALTVLGFSDTYGTGPGGQSPWFRDYQVDVYSGFTLIRSDFVTESKYVYTYEKNLEDGGPRRTVTFKIRARDLFGRYSQQAQITVNNPAPLAINTINVYAGYKSLVINYIRPPDNDWVGVIVFISETTGFTPSEVTRVYLGSDTTVTIPNLLENVPYFIRVAAYDAFGGESDYTLTAYEYTKTISSISLPSPEEIKNGLQTALDTAVDPLVFNADIFAVNLNGVDKTPFIIGIHEGNPAILMDADVVVTGTLSADQLVGGRIAATEDIIIGEGAARINGDGSIFVYNGNDTIVNRDFALLSGGTLSFQRYRGGEYFEYKAVRRVEYGQAPSGSTVALPGYWDAQPKIIVTPASLRSFDATYSSSSQTWTVRADNLEEIPVDGTVLVDTQLELILQGNADYGADYASKSSGTSGVFDAQAYSSIGTDQDCWISFKFNSGNVYSMVALNTDPQSNASWETLDFAIYSPGHVLNGVTNPIVIYESGVPKNGTEDNSQYGSWTSSDTFKIERSGTQIYYQKNGVTFAISAIPAGAILYFDTSFRDIGSGINSIQFWHKQMPAGSGSGRYTFDAVAELNYASSSGVNTPASNSGNLNVDGWYSGESILPNGTVAITVSVLFSSILGNGVSTYGYLYRSVSWTVQGWNGGAWISLATKNRPIAAAEHGIQITDTLPINIASGYSKIRVYFGAYNTNGTSYSRGADAYNYASTTPPVVPLSGDIPPLIVVGGILQMTSNGTATYTTPASSLNGWTLYAARFTADWGVGAFNNGGGQGWFMFNGIVYATHNVGSSQSFSGTIDTGIITYSNYTGREWSVTLSENGSGALAYITPTSTTLYYRQLIVNSAVPANNFTLQSYTWNIAGSTAIATGSLNWMAIGD